MAAVKDFLPADQFNVADKTLFVSSQSTTPRAAFAVVLVGIPGGLIPIEFDVPQTVDPLAQELAAALIDARATWAAALRNDPLALESEPLMENEVAVSVGARTAVADAAAVLGQQIRAARHDRNLTARELAERAGVSEKTVAATEAGSTSVTMGSAFSLAVAAGVRLFSLEDYDEITRERIRGAQQIALLPARVTHRRSDAISTDF
jgi:transcriptional regulator with XRE-family HTH domain